MGHNGAMTSSKQSQKTSRLGRLVGLTALAIAGAVLGTYAANLLRKDQQREQLLGALPADVPMPSRLAAGSQVEETALEAAVTASAVTHDVAGHEIEERTEPATGAALESRTVEELYELAKQHDIAGRSNMRKADLIEALQDAGVSETTK